MLLLPFTSFGVFKLEEPICSEKKNWSLNIKSEQPSCFSSYCQMERSLLMVHSTTKVVSPKETGSVPK